MDIKDIHLLDAAGLARLDRMLRMMEAMTEDAEWQALLDRMAEDDKHPITRRPSSRSWDEDTDD